MSAVHDFRVAPTRPERPSWPGRAPFARAGRNRSAIAVFGYFGAGNLGNEATLEAMLSLLREKRPDAALFCICREPAEVTRNFGVATIPIRLAPLHGASRILNRLLLRTPSMVRNLVAAMRIIRRAGVMVVPGTGILDDFGHRPSGLPFDVFKWCLAARLMGVSIAFISIGAGPIENRVSRWLMTRAAKMAHYRSCRDVGSCDFLASVGVDTRRDHIYPDLAFRLPIAEISSERSPGPLTVAVGIMNYHGWYAFRDDRQVLFDAYVAKMADFVRFLLERGHSVRLLTGDEGDAPALDAVLSAVGTRGADRISSPPVHSFHEVLRQMAGADIVVASRFHNIVASLMAGKPAISLGYARKNELLMQDMGLAEFCQNLGNFDVGLLTEQFTRLAGDLDDHALRIVDKVARYRNRLEIQDDYLAAAVL